MEELLRKRYKGQQWRTLVILMLGYAMYYFVRQNLAAALPTLQEELGLTKAKLGLFMTCNQVVYGVSKLISGMLADRLSAKKLMAMGLAAAAVCNIAIGFTPQMAGIFNFLDAGGKVTIGGIYFIGAMWVLNGFFQSFGYPPCASLMARWFAPSDLSTKQSIWNTSHNIGAGLVALLVAVILKLFGSEAWQWFFFLPAILAIFTSALIFFGLKDNPSDMGLPDPSEIDGKVEKKVVSEKESEEEQVVHTLSAASKHKLINGMSYGNPKIWLVAFSDFFVYVIRMLIISWCVMFLTEFKGMSVALAATVLSISEIGGGILGTLAAGVVTDRFFKSKAHQTSLVCTLLAVICLFLFWKCPNDYTLVSIVFLVLTSFFIYGPQALLGIAASNQATKLAAGTANGIVGIISYLSAILAGWGIGKLTDLKGEVSIFGYTGWDLVFILAMIFGLAGAFCLALMWKAPADGYAQADKLARELKAKEK